MKKFRYLDEHAHADAWINGGKVPLRLASSYRSVERNGIMTPDENLIYKSNYDLDQLRPALNIGNGVQNIRIGIAIIDGVVRATDLQADRYEDDGIILCLSNSRSSTLAAMMDKTICVEIQDVGHLKSVIDAQLKTVGTAAPCTYTDSYERNHFLKDKADAWQDEFRLFWPVVPETQPVWVELPPGIAILVPL